MIDAALDVLHDGSGWLLITASVAVVVAIRHLRHLHRLRAAAARLEADRAARAASPLWRMIDAIPEEERATWWGGASYEEETWSNVAVPPGGQRYISESGLDQIELDARSAYTAARIADGIRDGTVSARLSPAPKPTLYDWSDDDDLA